MLLTAKSAEQNAVLCFGAKTWASSEKEAEKAFHSYLQRRARGATPVVVIHDLPYHGQKTGDIPDCLAQHIGQVHERDGTPASWQW